MTATYDCIATTTLGSATNTVTFSSISGSYTDLILVCQGKMAAGSVLNNLIRFNGDSSSLYSRTFMYAAGSSAASGRSSSQTSLAFPYWDSTNPNITIVQIMNYSNTTTYKTAISRNSQPLDSVTAEVGMWRNTAAITSIDIIRGSTNDFASGSTFTLYGIKAE